jgi:hypothetical protein
VWRLSLYEKGYYFIQEIGDKNVTAVDLSVLAQIPSFFFIGLGEIFAVISGLTTI